MELNSPLLKRAFDLNQVLHPLETNDNSMSNNPSMDKPVDVAPLLKGLNTDIRK